jgi:16S rRNA (guanine1207-N2)-methyltransferase
MNTTDQFLDETIKGVKLKLQPKVGVFAKGNLDPGSKLLIESVVVEDNMVVADLGSGAGVIGLALAKIYPKAHFHLLEEHLRAHNLALENLKLNRVKNVEGYLSDLFSAVSDRTYHLIVSNPPQHLGNELLEEAAKEAFHHLKEKGEVYWVVQKHVRAYIERLFENVFKNCTIVAHNKDYVVIKAIKNG